MDDEKKKVTQNITLCFLPIITIVLEALPYGAVCIFAAGPEERIRRTFSYFSMLPFGYANFGPLITAVLTCLIVLLLLIYFMSKKESLLKNAKVVTYIAIVTSLMPLLYGIDYFSVIAFLISLMLVLEVLLFKRLGI